MIEGLYSVEERGVFREIEGLLSPIRDLVEASSFSISFINFSVDSIVAKVVVRLTRANNMRTCFNAFSISEDGFKSLSWDLSEYNTSSARERALLIRLFVCSLFSVRFRSRLTSLLITISQTIHTQYSLSFAFLLLLSVHPERAIDFDQFLVSTNQCR